MPWTGGRLSSSLNRMRRTRGTETNSPKPKEISQNKWHQNIQACGDIIGYLELGEKRPETNRLHFLDELTTKYLQINYPDELAPSELTDECLDTLVARHDALVTKDVAILACVGSLSKSTTINHLKLLFNNNCGRYLRLLSLCQEMNPQLLSNSESKILPALLDLLDDPNQTEVQFRWVAEVLYATNEDMDCLPLSLIRSVFSLCDVRDHLQSQLNLHLKTNRYLSLYLQYKWLRDLNLEGHDIATAFLEEYLPSWRCIMQWRPDENNIRCGQNANFSDVQKSKLSKALALEGPDIATHKEKVLQDAIPHCFSYANVDPHSQEMLKKFSESLYKSASIGGFAVDLFIQLCVDSSANEESFRILDVAFRETDATVYEILLLMLRVLDTNVQSRFDIATQVRSLTNALIHFVHNSRFQDLIISALSLSGRVISVLGLARSEFCDQLETGTGEYMGMLLLDLGIAVSNLEHLHSDLSTETMSYLQNLPTQEVLEAIFQQLEDEEHSVEGGNTRFKSYLASALGNRAMGTGVITLSTIKDEIKFWKQRPDSSRKALSKTLAKLHHLDYDIYTAILLGALKEDDLLIINIRHKISFINADSCIDLALYLFSRRKLDQLKDECWLLIPVALSMELEANSLAHAARHFDTDRWVEVADQISHLVTPVFSKLPRAGTGLSQELISWWQIISRDGKNISGQILANQISLVGLSWLYFPSSQSQRRSFHQFLNIWDDMTPIKRNVLLYLKPNGDNVDIICRSINDVDNLSELGFAIITRLLERMKSKSLWLSEAIRRILHYWQESESLTPKDQIAIGSIGELFGFRSSSQDFINVPVDCSSTQALGAEYNEIIDKARYLESLRMRFHHKEPVKLATLLQQTGIENAKHGRTSNEEIPIELIDSLSVIGHREYEMCFPLTKLSELHRVARGIPGDARILLIRVSFRRRIKYQIHFQDADAESGLTHIGPSNLLQFHQNILTTHSNLFTYYLSSHLVNTVPTRDLTLQAFHDNILGFIAANPSTCLVCQSKMDVKLFKPSTCSIPCSLALRRVPLEVRLHNLRVDPLSIDLLLSSVYAAAGENSGLKLLPGCPVEHANIQRVINSFPTLSHLQTVNDLATAIGGSDSYAKAREDLISWLCLSFRGFMLTAPDGFKIPSMPQTIQFLLVNSHHEREASFRQHRVAAGGRRGPVFHGTKASRLFLILSQGLCSMSNTKFMAHGAASGAGVYCADEQATSIPFAGSTGQSWRHSTLHHMTIILGCELAGHTPAAVHVVPVHDRLLVRYVFLLPRAYVPPPRHHVDQALNTAFAKLQSGLLA